MVAGCYAPFSLSPHETLPSKPSATVQRFAVIDVTGIVPAVVAFDNVTAFCLTHKKKGVALHFLATAVDAAGCAAIFPYMGLPHIKLRNKLGKVKTTHIA